MNIEVGKDVYLKTVKNLSDLSKNNFLDKICLNQSKIKEVEPTNNK